MYEEVRVPVFIMIIIDTETNTMLQSVVLNKRVYIVLFEAYGHVSLHSPALYVAWHMCNIARFM